MRETQLDQLCGLRQTALSWVLYVYKSSVCLITYVLSVGNTAACWPARGTGVYGSIWKFPPSCTREGWCNTVLKQGKGRLPACWCQHTTKELVLYSQIVDCHRSVVGGPRVLGCVTGLVAPQVSKCYFIFIFKGRGDRGSIVVKVLCYKSEGRWFDSTWCHWNFSST